MICAYTVNSLFSARQQVSGRGIDTQVAVLTIYNGTEESFTRCTCRCCDEVVNEVSEHLLLGGVRVRA